MSKRQRRPVQERRRLHTDRTRLPPLDITSPIDTTPSLDSGSLDSGSVDSLSLGTGGMDAGGFDSSGACTTSHSSALGATLGRSPRGR